MGQEARFGDQAPGARTGDAGSPGSARLQQGPAYTKDVSAPPARPGSPGDWPTFRHDNARSGFSGSTIGPRLTKRWTVKAGDKLSAMTVGEGRLFVADKDAHSLHALDAESGKRAWSRLAGARIDSPPAIVRGRVLFGSRDGFLYCLDAADGGLRWRYRVAPAESYLLAKEQLESVWPVHGSPLVIDDRVYCVAGRSAFLDGGMRLVCLDIETGRKLHEAVLNDSGFHRILMLYGRTFSGGDMVNHEPPKYAPGVKMLAFSKTHVFGFSRLPHLHRWVRELEWHIYKARKTDRKPMPPRGENGPEIDLSAHDVVIQADTEDAQELTRLKKSLLSSAIKYDWSFHDPDIYVNCMLATEDWLYVAGPPAIRNEETTEALDKWQGRRGGSLWCLSTGTGEKMWQLPLPSPPVHEGMAAANG